MSRRLPPLNALRAFEAAGRSGSFVAAGSELNVSPSAVSQQVRKLEAFFAKRLFDRGRNSLVLTDAGRAVYEDTARHLDGLVAMTTRVLEDEIRPRLVVSVLSSLANRWLASHISALTKQEDDIRIDVLVAEDPVDFARDEIDIRICYGRHLYPELAVVELGTDSVVPLAAPTWIASLPGDAPRPLDLSDDDLIHTNWGPSFASHPTWADWFQSLGIDRRPDISKGHRVALSSQAIELARAGVGLCLGQTMLAREDLSTGSLIPISRQPLTLRHPYCAVHPHRKAKRPDLQRFVHILLQGSHIGLRAPGAKSVP
ncbi:MAG: LysR substrate-binding domain-containing protein [Pseudomonadota bacterium]